MIRLNLGCGVHIRRNFINLDLYKASDLKSKKKQFVNVKWDKGAKYIQGSILKLPFKDNYADYVELIDVIEHIPWPQNIPALKEICRVMKKGAKMVLVTNNMDGMALEWLEMILRKQFEPNRYIYTMEAIYGNQRALEQGEFHRSAMNPSYLAWCLREAGFTEVDMTLCAKDSPMIQLGTIPPKPKTVFRNDHIVVEVTK